MPKIDVPQKLQCPITKQIFHEPVIAKDGVTYEKSAIEKWVKEHGTSPTTKEKMDNTFNPNKEKNEKVSKFLTEKNICTQEEFLRCIRKGNLEEIEKLNYTKRNLEAEISGTTPLIEAVSEGHVNIIKMLLENKVDLTPKNSTFGDTALLSAVRKGHLEIVKLLLENNADIEARNSKNYTPLMLAAEYSSTSINSQKENEEYCSFRHLAIKDDGTPDIEVRVEVMKLLLNKGANIEASNDNHETPLMLAVKHGAAMSMKLLLERDANTEARDSRDYTPLMWVASQFGEYAKAKALGLLSYGADYKVVPQSQSRCFLSTSAQILIEEYPKIYEKEIKKAPQRIYDLENTIKEQQRIIEKQQKELEQLESKFSKIEVVLAQLTSNQISNNNNTNIDKPINSYTQTSLITSFRQELGFSTDNKETHTSKVSDSLHGEVQNMEFNNP